MAYTIKGDLNATHIKVQGKTVGGAISTTDNDTVYTANESGHVALPIPTSSEIDYILNQFPLSQYGSINNNAVGVAGTFDGGSTPAYYSAMPVLLEEDGSLVYLRPGTNGSTINYYYTYINNPVVSMQPYTTINHYYSGSWKNILFTASDTKTALLYEEVGNNAIHVVLTNGTLRKSAHKEAVIVRTLIPHYMVYALVIGTYYYIVTIDSSTFILNNPTTLNISINDPLQFGLYRIPVAEINAGSVVTVERVSGISGKTMYGDDITSQNFIRIADKWASADNTSDKSFIKYPSVITNVVPVTYSIYGSVRAIYDGTNLRIGFSENCFISNNVLRSDTRYDFTVTFNMNTGVYTSNLTPTPVISTGTATSLITWSNPYYANSSNLWGSNDNEYSDGMAGTIYITKNGIQYFIREKYVLSDVYQVYRSKIENFTSVADAYSYRGRTVTLQERFVVNQDFASRVGDQLLSCTPISSSRVIFSGTGTYNGVYYGKYDKGVADIGTTRTYTYNSYTRGTITGYAPQSFRVPLTVQSQVYSGVSLCDTSGNVQFYGTAFTEGKNLTVGYKLDANTLTFDKTFSIPSSVLVGLKNSILTSLGLSPQDSKIGLYYCPDSSYSKSVATIVTHNGGNNGGNKIIATVDTTVNTSQILTATVNTVIYNTFDAAIQSVSPFEIDEMNRHAGLSCVKYSDFTYIAFSNLVGFTVPGDTREESYCGIVSGSTISSLIASRSYHASIDPVAREYGYIPNFGFGYFTFYNSDNGTKLIFKQCGNTLAQFNANMAAGTGTDTVILAQDVPQGFYLYFTEVTPLFMAGQYFDVPISVIKLDDVVTNPSNKTFYIYIQLVLGSPQYVASLSEIPESNTTMFLGTITTDGTKVATLNIKKVSRFDVYRPSLTQIGSAFPVSSGNPAQSGSIGW
ncbi:hypothetical protein GAP32_144 [Cronobacter phage vB_CsaM_GAP32]|uniref:Putative membrane protein n=1 Tax=Cronobacter phage vB_CsaM_GAP32 TaxID=1141136 RepID=K4FB23_9CAUD|nr:hypothetical protein GAP32_144 [Cronobacter phage vB_CsaM_GAP32]AFC21594.1 putative membrane protein [Cronobacter phage vB_CsaM_GAP32]